jgi:hypothetical protein
MVTWSFQKEPTRDAKATHKEPKRLQEFHIITIFM